MTIEQKARELLERNFILPTAHQIGLVEIGIIEGLEMAHERIALIYGTESHAAKSIRALIEEQKL